MKLYFESKKSSNIKEHYVDDEFLSGDKVRYFNDYYEAKKYAEDLGLKESEYGTMYGCSYCCWNKAGNRNYPEEVCAYYEFKNGRPIKLSLDMAEKVKKYTDVDFLDDEDYWEDMKPYFENKASNAISKVHNVKYFVEPHKLDMDLYDIVFIDTHSHGGERAHSKRFESEQDAWNFIKKNARYNNWLV